MNNPQIIRIYFDGLCQLCSREMDMYKANPEAKDFEFVDITSPNFSAEREGLDPFRVHKVMHVRMPTGEIKTGVDAFIQIWSLMPRFHWLAKVSQRSFVKPILNIGYHAFAFIRPFLPKRKIDCSKSPYCEDRKNKK